MSKKLLHFYADPAIGSPLWGWALRWHRVGETGFGIWRKQMDSGLYVGCWRTYRLEWIRIPERMREGAKQ